MKAVVLGSGLVGGLIAADLARDCEVTVIDVDQAALDRLAARTRVKTVLGSAVDLSVVADHTAGADVVCGAVPGRLGFEMLRMLIDLKANVADISFMPQDFLELDQDAQAAGVTVVPDFGVAPGMSHLLVGRGAHLLDEVDRAIIYVGGIPANPKPPWNFKVVFSPEDTIDEYIRPVHYIEDGQPRTVDALSGLEQIDFPGVGRLEAFFTDGLRSLTKNIKARHLAEKTMRYPGHAEMMAALRQAGMFDDQPRQLAGVEITPLKATSELLFSDWEMKPEAGDRDLTLMRIVVSGLKDGRATTYTWELNDSFDEESGYHSMARTTGFPCAIMARAIARGMVDAKGVIAPEKLASNDGLFNFLLSELESRGIHYTQTVTTSRTDWA